VKFLQSGGYAGLIRGCEIDTESLTPKEADVLQSLIKKSNIKGNRKFSARGGARDLNNYVITVESKDELHTISFDDMTVPAEIKDLLSFLAKRSKPQKPI